VFLGRGTTQVCPKMRPPLWIDVGLKIPEMMIVEILPSVIGLQKFPGKRQTDEEEELTTEKYEKWSDHNCIPYNSANCPRRIVDHAQTASAVIATAGAGFVFLGNSPDRATLTTGWGGECLASTLQAISTFSTASPRS
jgi:hypothetical protein